MHPAITERWLIELYRHLRNGNYDQAQAVRDIVRAGYSWDDTVVWYTWQAIMEGTNPVIGVAIEIDRDN